MDLRRFEQHLPAMWAVAWLWSANLALTWGLPAATVDTTYPYTGPAVPIADLVDHTINGNPNVKGFTRLYEAPAVKPTPGSIPSNNVNVISLSYVPGGMNVHFQTPFGLGEAPSIQWGEHDDQLWQTATGSTKT